MDSYHDHLQEEKQYLREVIALIEKELSVEANHLSKRKSELVASRKEMWENTVHFTTDFEKLTEVNQHLSEVTNQTASYDHTRKRLDRYRQMTDRPYFGRFDFAEDGCDEADKIYVGLYNLMDSETHDIFVYDWRAPISSIFYRFEPGEARYHTPFGDITGDVLLKRQYKIKKSELDYFFDCSIRINDEMLQEVLSRNASAKMRNIVETIQKEQDIIIRDTENELLIVQGVAGSGKTSIALHRIAFLVYQGMDSKIGSNNIIIVSPNALFSKYISGVLPELGEENVNQITVEEIINACFDSKMKIQTRNEFLESVIGSKEDAGRNSMQQGIEFKGSRSFKMILDRLLWHFEHRLVRFEDVYYGGAVVETRQQLKNSFLNNKIGMPVAKRLKRLENKILEKVRPLQKIRLEKIQKIVGKNGEHQFEIKSFSRLLSIKDTKVFLERLRTFTQVDSLSLYQKLFANQELFYKVAQDIALPENIQHIISSTADRLQNGRVLYEDALPLLYLKLKLEGTDLYSEVKQVVVDEAQDYYPMHYEILKILFHNATFTVLGDVHQTIERNVQISYYEDIVSILDKRKAVKLFLNKSYRASFEINTFAQKLLNVRQDFISFERHEDAPAVVYKKTEKLLEQTVIQDITDYLKQGFESVAVICKTQQQTEKLYHTLKEHSSIRILNEENSEIEKGSVIISVYKAKGLEFDVALVYGVDEENYSSDMDRKLLYISCTRALHRLGLYYTGQKSPLLSNIIDCM